MTPGGLNPPFTAGFEDGEGSHEPGNVDGLETLAKRRQHYPWALPESNAALTNLPFKKPSETHARLLADRTVSCRKIHRLVTAATGTERRV